ncbi:uncharacterized protein KY384_006018 [Bacidia gigantensis]|uniref:uncharacterized protein n=1 Tax=Bacidia gigantensis TaxID=2732470 RepID=UPI001D04A491|nr:uncharacterized protein KY384_006018 [Bacidia gigantensis]KAG8529382.1 hypothetical protein KY384_006018 [Bacidia gigantensis]
MQALDDDQWGFAPAINLIHSISSVQQNKNAISYTHPISVDDAAAYRDVDRDLNLTANLGDFDTIWRFLGLPSTSLGEDEVAKTVRWRDEVDGADLADDDDNEDDDRLAGLTKKQRKRVRRKARERAAIEGLRSRGQGKSGDSENESGEDREDDSLAGLTKQQRKKVRRQARLEAFKASLKSGTAFTANVSYRQPGIESDWNWQGGMLNSSTEQANEEDRHQVITNGLSNGKDILSAIDSTFVGKSGIGDGLASLPNQQQNVARQKVHEESNVHRLRNGKVFATDADDKGIRQADSCPLVDRRSIIHEWMKRPIPLSRGLDATAQPFRPSRTQSSLLPHANAVKAPNELSEPSRIINEPPPPHLKPLLVYKSSTETDYSIATARKVKLIHMLNERFYGERPFLSNISILHQNEDHVGSALAGVHVFIDASNIMIGFHDALKMLWKMPKQARIHRQPFSFHSLSLILCRGRPTAKCVVVGSDNSSEMSEAKLIGYETNILDRVHKAKDITPRRKGYHAGNGTHSAGSGSETIAKAPEKWVEQAVDEILHLKMMESVVDAREPATMVLATGDAAEAEYSGGFLKMIERALGKGWKVELVCWKQNMSSAYRKYDFRQAWGDNFKVIELDEFVELLYGA